MTFRYTLPVGDGDRDVLSAQLWSAGASGVWDQEDELVAWFPTRADGVPEGGRWEEEPPRDWLADWKRGLDPVRVGPFTITPSWRLQDVADDDPIVIDPAMAFGTGHHATTRLCVERLVELDLRGARVTLRLRDDDPSGWGHLLVDDIAVLVLPEAWFSVLEGVSGAGDA